MRKELLRALLVVGLVCAAPVRADLQNSTLPSVKRFEARLFTSQRASDDLFGYSVAVSADGATVVSAAHPRLGQAIYVFERDSGWTSRTQTSRLVSSDKAAQGILGWSIAISADGNTIAAGTPGYVGGKRRSPGAVYIFERGRGRAHWVQTAKLVASDAENSLGDSVAISADGSAIAAGAPDESPEGTIHAGAVYVFERGSGWTNRTESAKLTLSHKAGADALGWSVAVSADGSTVVAGAYYANGRAGAAYVFQRDSRWTDRTESAKLVASDRGSAEMAFLGWSVAISADGSTIVAGAVHGPGVTERRGADYVFQTGAVYVFQKGSGWTERRTEAAKLFSSDKTIWDGFGSSGAVSSDGSTIAVTAHHTGPLGDPHEGALYVFRKSQGWTSWKETAKFIASGKHPDEILGPSLAISADGRTVVAGAEDGKNAGGKTPPGAVYVFGER